MCDSHGIDRIIIPPAIAADVIRQTDLIYVRECTCRAEMQNCPPDTWEVCLLFEHASPDALLQAKRINTDEALSILKETAGCGAIYNLFYRRRDHYPTEMCSCCTCCCRPIRQMRDEARYGEYARSGYVATTDAARCMGCGLCLESCAFEARKLRNGEIHLHRERCFGCGRCVDYCSEGAISLAFSPAEVRESPLTHDGNFILVA